jgi:capsular exopolysaccharide synthesis family protein
MTSTEHSHREQTLTDYLTIVRRHIWTIVIIAVVVPVSAFIVSRQQPKVYSASSTVLLSRQDLGSALTGVAGVDTYGDPDRAAQTQTAIARTQEVAQQAINRAGLTGMLARKMLDNSSVSQESNADILRFTVDDGNPTVATKLANAYADAFAANKYRMDTSTLARARKELDKRVAELRNAGQTATQVYQDLLGQAQKLRTIELLQTRATVVKRATTAEQIAPTPARNAILAAVLGLVLGLGVAFLRNSLDKRVRTEEEVERILDIPLLARLPKPGRQSRRADRLSMLDEPSDTSAEAVRRLRTNLELANLDGNAKVILVTSAAAGEGKSTTIANLAVALGRAGRSVALVDLDLRRPIVATFFDLEGRPGVTDVALGRISLEDALVPVQLPVPLSMSLNGQMQAAGAEHLHILPCGPVPANPGEFVGTQSVAHMLQQLRSDHEFVLVDAPPLLSVGDAMILSTRVDAMFAVVRIGNASRPMLKDLARGLAASPAAKLGFVVTGVDEHKLYGTSAYGYYTKADAPKAPTPLRGMTSSGR